MSSKLCARGCAGIFRAEYLYEPTPEQVQLLKESHSQAKHTTQPHRRQLNETKGPKYQRNIHQQRE